MRLDRLLVCGLPQTAFEAETAGQFGWAGVWDYIRNTGIPINFGITIATALLVGVLVSGQTSWL